MKKLLSMIMLLTSVAAFAQNTTGTAAQSPYTIANAKAFMNARNANYSPEKAYQVYSRLAAQGNAEAMNAVGIMFNTGVGVTADTKQAFNWFTKATNAGYAPAWYNLGLMYKNGVEVAQNDQQAFSCFSKGAVLNHPMCLYGAGYMLYKGLGVKQDYTQAYQYFEKGVARNDEGSMYMLGLCFRNGYGVAVNIDSARYWLAKAAARNDNRAINELADVKTENQNIQSVPNLQPAASVPQSQSVNLQSGFKKVAHRINSGNADLSGVYHGFVIKFDWSGKHIIGQQALKLTLKRNKTQLSGTWTEDGQNPVALDGTLTDTALVFNNTSGAFTDHYHQTNPQQLQFKNSMLNLVQSRDTVYLSGTLALYSPQWHETQRPEFIMLIRTGDTQNSFAGNNSHPDSAKVAADSLHFVAYPNPFNGRFQLRYTLKKAAMVNIMISDLLSGRIVYHTQSRQETAGDHTAPVSFNGQPGNYVATLQYGSKIRSVVIIKQ